MVDREGQQLGNYRLIRLLGEGGFAEVYLGEHIHLGTQTAIKVLHTQMTNDDIDQFRAEARTIAHLEHPHIVRILDFGVEGKTPFLVMSYAPNGTLRQCHPKGLVIPLPLIVTYVKQLADALHYAHDEKIIHRDIKPENMLLGRRNEVLLSDFGIATTAQSSRYQSTQEMAGTMAYMAPEQIQGKPRLASDQYSLGIVVYEWLSGDRPFHGSLTELVGQHLSALPPPLHEKLPDLSPAVEDAVLTALAKDPKQRFPSIEAFASALEQACQLSYRSSSHRGTQMATPDYSQAPPIQEIETAFIRQDWQAEMMLKQIPPQLEKVKAPSMEATTDRKETPKDAGKFKKINDLFDKFFGTAPQTQSSVDKQGGAHLRYDLTIAFEEAVFGCQKELILQRWETCPTCYSDGLQSRNQAMPCQKCHNQGRVYVKRRAVVNIPAGVDNGINVRLAGEGEVTTPGGTPGDLYVILSVKPHHFFKRRGNDLIYELTVNAHQALSGGKVQIPLVDNKFVTLKIPPSTKKGRSFRLKGLGVPFVNSSARGDQIVIVKEISF